MSNESLIRLLLFEFIHADESAYVDAPPGLRIEGRAMLNALASDAAEAHGIAPTVLLCGSAIRECRRFAQTVDVHIVDASRPLIEQLPALSDNFDAVLPVAPECDQLLLHVAKALAVSHSDALLPSYDFVETCSDKLRTCQGFLDAGLPMLECNEIGASIFAGEHSGEWVFKDRWGAGCEGIYRGRPSSDCSAAQIFQRWIDGVSISVGVIGNGQGAVVLPIAHQHVEWIDGRPEYLGGHIPATVELKTTQQVDAITQRVLTFSGEFAGYLGIDFLVENSTGNVFLNEVNPRMCTSYIGYRRLLRQNPVELMMGITPLDTGTLRMGSVSFDKYGVSTEHVD